MRFSQLFGHTLHEDPSGADTPGYRLLLRAGFIRPLSAGIFSLLPLGYRVKAKLEAILREEMQAIGGQEILMPVVQPAEIWKRTGRWEQIGVEMGRLKDRAGRDLALAMTHEEAVASLAAGEIRSYRDLPRLVYHLQTKWRDDPRPRAGLIRVREFTMLDSYSLDESQAGLETQYRAQEEAYQRIFRRCGLPVIEVGADPGMMGGQTTHEYMYLSPVGEDTILLCPSCPYRANRQVARMRKPAAAKEIALPLEEVATPGAATIEALAGFLRIPPARTAKSVLMMARTVQEDGLRDQFVFGVIRGDLEVNETKLANAAGAVALRPATAEEIRAAGAVPGFASPVGARNAFIVADDSVATSPNLVAGANREGFHLRNVNLGRDYAPDRIADIAAAGEGDACPDCAALLQARRGVEVANIFQLGTRYSLPMGVRFLARDGSEQPVVMGSYGIGVGRLMACIAEEHHDEQGLVWPASVAPYAVHIVALGCADQAEEIQRRLAQAGIESLYDDRNERAGVQFADADLIGAPIRITVSDRSIRQGGVEVKLRNGQEKRILPLESVEQEILREWRSVADSG
jgi:prolyl-tRNA synthetase